MTSTTSTSLWSTVAALPDYLLLVQTRQLAQHEQALQILVLDHLREIEARELHLTRGYGSLFDYVVRELGYTAAAAWRRIKAMRLSTQIGVAGELLRDGSLALSNAAQLQNLFERSDRNQGRRPGSHGTGGGLGKTPRSDDAAGAPAPAAPICAGERDPEPAGGPVLDAAAREELVKQAVGKSTREVQQMLAEVDPELARPSDRLRALGSGRWELKAAVDTECRHGLEKLQMLLSHTDRHLTLGGLVARLVREGLDRHDPERPRRARRSAGRGSANGARTATEPGRNETNAVQRRAASANSGEKAGDAELRNEVEQNGASLAGARAGAARFSAAKLRTDAERGNTKPAPVRDVFQRAASAPKQHSVSPTARPTRGGRTNSAARWHRRAEPDRPLHRPDSAPERGGQDEDTRTAGAERPGGSAAPVPRRQRATEHACEPPKAMGGSGGAAVPRTNRQRRNAGLGRNEAKGGVPGRATCAAAPHVEAGEHNASCAPAPGRWRFTTSAAKRLQYAAGHGAVGPAERSPDLERHLAALTCLRALPDSRSRYVPVAAKREVWRRDRGCCSFVDPHSGRRCGSRYRLEIDHIVPFALGGATEPGNLRLRCRAHHRYRHAQRHDEPGEGAD